MVAFQSQATNLDSVSDSGGDEDVFVVEFAMKNPTDPNPQTADYEIKSLTRISGARDASGNLTGEAYETDENSADSTRPAIFGTKDAYVVTFKSEADNMYPPELWFWNEDSNKKTDVYVWDSKFKLLSRANVDSDGTQGSDDAVCNSCKPAIAPDGKVIGFDTDDVYLVPNILGNGYSQIYTRKYVPAKLLNPNLF